MPRRRRAAHEKDPYGQKWFLTPFLCPGAFPDPSHTAGAALRRRVNLADKRPVHVGERVNDAGVADALELTRTSRPRDLQALPAGVTDLRFQRVVTGDALVGVHLKR